MICKDLKEIIPPGGIGEGGGDQGSGISCPALPTGSIVRRGNGILCMKLREEIVVSQVLSQGHPPMVGLAPPAGLAGWNPSLSSSLNTRR